MSRIKPSKFEIFLNYKLWLSSVTGEGIIEEDRYKLLQLIKEKGSLKAAADTMQISYRKAWGDLRKAETCLGLPVIHRVRGGRGGGATTLTAQGLRLIKAFRRFRHTVERCTSDAFTALQEELAPCARRS